MSLTIVFNPYILHLCYPISSLILPLRIYLQPPPDYLDEEELDADLGDFDDDDMGDPTGMLPHTFLCTPTIHTHIVLP